MTEELLAAAEAALEQIVDDIRRLVEVESPSHDHAAVRECGQALLALVRERLGEPDDVQECRPDDAETTYVVTYRGTGDGHVTILSHYDTVWPVGTIADIPFGQGEVDGRETLVGPGVLDMKAGLIQGLWALKLLRDSGAPTPMVTFVFNPDEEIGSPSSRPVIERMAAASEATLSLEPTADGAIKTGRKGIGICRVTATGVEAHAGLEPEKGASAIHAVAEAIGRIVAVARPELGTTLNVGRIEGGTADNVVAGRCSAGVDIRVLDPAEMERVDADLGAIRAQDERVDLTIDVRWNRPPMVLTDASRPLLDLAQRTARTLGREVGHVTVGGASDANFVAPLGKPVLCGMGAVGNGPHARHEHVFVDSLGFQTALVAGMLAELA